MQNICHFPQFLWTNRVENKERKLPVYYSDICKYELRSADRRAAKSMANIFFKLTKLQQISGKVNLVTRKCQNKGQKSLPMKHLTEKNWIIL